MKLSVEPEPYNYILITLEDYIGLQLHWRISMAALMNELFLNVHEEILNVW